MEPTPKIATTELGSDRPIESKTQDRLGRAKFADNLARAIDGWKEDESLVIAISGEWGIGKSSLKNLVLEELRTGSSRSPPDVIQFNPWQWTGHETISAAFFRDLLAVLSGQSNKKAKELVRTLRRYAAYLGLIKAMLSGPKGLLSAALLILGLLSIVPPLFITNEQTRVLATICGAAALAIAAIVAWSEDILKKIAAWKEFSGPGEQTLEERKLDVISALGRYGRTLIVVIDDVDRLTKMEIQAVFQLVKANADFPRFVYLIMFQRNIVESALSELTNEESGRHFLEKIIHVSFDVPRASQDEVDNVLGEGLSRVLGSQASNAISQVYWGNVYFGALRTYFQDLRDVKRFLASFEFHANLLRTNGTLDVNSVDLIAIEAIRLFDPDLYRAIKAAKGLLTVSRPGDSSTKKRLTEEINAVADAAIQLPKGKTKELIGSLFPTAAFAFGGTEYASDFHVEWNRDLRICAPAFFDRYFQFGLSEGEIPQYRVDRLLSLGANHKELLNELEILESNGQLIAALDRLDFNKDKIAAQNAVPTLTALFDISEKLPSVEPSAAFNDPDWSITRIAYALLKGHSESERVSMIEQILKATLALRVPMRFVGVSTPSTERGSDQERVIIPESSVQAVHQMCVDKIKSTAAEGQLLHRHDLAYILYRWRDWDSEEVARVWAKGITTKSPEQCLAFLRAFLHKGSSQSISDHVARITYSMKYAELEDFVDVEAIEQEVNKLLEAKLSENDRRVIQEFRKAVARRRSGKSEDAFASDRD